jgi:2-iminobutanoate/2-iminopropanoate deaminase
MLTKTTIASPEAPPALGPYSQAVKVNDTVYVSGQLPINAKTGQLVEGGIEAQAEQVLLNIRCILEEGEASLRDVVKVTIFLTDLSDFAAVNRVYELFFPTNDHSGNLLPARSTVEVSRLPRGASLEMDAIAIIGGSYIDSELY